MSTWYLRTPSRVHLGLMELDSQMSGAYAGMGILLDDPGFLLRWWSGGTAQNPSSIVGATPDPAWGIRIEQASRAWSKSRSRGLPRGCIDVLRAPPPHAGFGSGTQLACGVATLLEWVSQQTQPEGEGSWRAQEVWEANGDSEAAITRLANACERGLRSMIGVAGFLYGGWILDAGRGNLPRIHGIRNTHYQILLVMVRSDDQVSGDREAAFIQECAERTNASGPEMRAVLEQQIRPALVQSEFEPNLGEALYRYGCLAGEMFRPVQGGIFRSVAIASMVEDLRAMGVVGVGQSSWGPAIYGVVDQQLASEEMGRISNMLDHHPLVQSYWWSKVNTTGASLAKM